MWSGFASDWRRNVPKYDFDDISVATDDFSSGRKLGGGSSSSVYYGTLQGSPVAVKVMETSEYDYENSFDQELRVLGLIHHANIVELRGWGETDRQRFIIYEFLAGSDLARKLWRSRNGASSFPWQHRLSVACDAARGLSHMVNSTPRAFHCDIKAANILLDGTGQAKVADFGVAGTERHLEQDVDDEVVRGTPGYTCPVYLEGGSVTEQSEVYSFGIVLLELLVNQPVAAKKASRTIRYPLRDLIGLGSADCQTRVLQHLDPMARWPDALASEVAALALQCTAANPAERPLFHVVLDNLERLFSAYTGHTPSASGGLPVEDAEDDLWACGLWSDDAGTPAAAAAIWPDPEGFTAPRSPTRRDVVPWPSQSKPPGREVEQGWWDLPEVLGALGFGACCKAGPVVHSEHKVIAR